VNEPLGLDDTDAGVLSPALLPVVGKAGVMVTWGDNETDAFKAQSHVYAARLRSAGLPVVEHECPRRHHFDIVDDLVDPTSPLGSFVLGRARRT
jgi:arylformamidase